MRVSLLLSVLLWPTWGFAQNVTLIVAERRGEDRAHFVAQLPDASQIDLDVPLSSATVDGLRAAIVAKRTPPVPLLPVGTVINLAVPPPTPPPPPVPPLPTALETWLENARRLALFKALGLTSPAALADLDSLQKEVDTTYQPGFVDEL